MIIEGNLVDIKNEEIYPARVSVVDKRISKIEKIDKTCDSYILPGFIDAHVHIESSMLVPSEFAQLAVIHGTVATVSDPHEIGNVMGVEGVEYMIENGKQVNFKFNFGAPSCVPATVFETAGAEISANDIEGLLKRPEIKYLAEMMNWPGVLYDDPIVFNKIELAKKYNKPIDGHAPGLRGEQARKYISAGISTDHECFDKNEAQEKLKEGMKIIIREGSAAKNFEALIELMHDHSADMMFCSDDKHPDNLVEGHINQLVKRALDKNIDFFKVLRAACINPVEHYKLDVGLLKEGDFADFIIVNNLKDLNVLSTYINGECVASKGKSNLPVTKSTIINNFSCSVKKPDEFKVKSKGGKINVIEALEGELITNSIVVDAKSKKGFVVSDTAHDILKIAVVNRYNDSAPAVAFIKGFGLKEGALASSVGHDSHNIIAVGTNDTDLCEAVNLIIAEKGGISVVNNNASEILALPVAGIMSTDNGYKVSERYKILDKMAKELGCSLQSPYMTLSFMALLVIPSLKLSDKGLFDGERFTFKNLFA